MTQTCYLFLGAGYGSRLQRDIVNSEDPKYTPLLGVAKALLPLNGKPLLDHWLDLIHHHGSSITDVYVVCNAFNHPQFQKWADHHKLPPTNLWNDGTTSNETRRGAVVDLAEAVKQFQFAERGCNVVVVAGDTLFLKDFRMEVFLERARGLRGACLTTGYDVANEETRKTGILEVGTRVDASHDHGNTDGLIRIRGFIEKPAPEETPSRLACPCFYFLPAGCMPQLETFLKEKREGGAQLDEIDATGKFLAWLVPRYPVYCLRISGRLDIGGLASYKEAEEYLKA
ncbi:hypothetical protein HK102_011474 [Quaeritorhiza haematococci]|nr:hypothetical protein HK102_011474 [Quaeritorhiza haematococci]